MTAYQDLPIDETVVERYRQNYKLGPDIGEEHVKHHVELEGRLTQDLLASKPDERWQVFEKAYSMLYTELPWLNKADDDDATVGRVKDFSNWTKLVKEPAFIFEIGSGKAELLKFFAARGNKCVATEVTRERGARHSGSSDNIEWHSTDGVNLDQFEPKGAYDVVISTQVIEHLHPDDLVTHFSAARAIAKPEGIYIFDTPHRGTGPHDLSAPLGYQRPKFMHLKEYDYAELRAIVKRAGYRRVGAVFRRRSITFSSGLLLSWYCAIDNLFTALNLKPETERRIRLSRLFQIVGPQANIWMIAYP